MSLATPVTSSLVKPASAERTWWKEAVVYQIYPRSFMDSNGDGIGDLPGVISKLDYLQDLGINVIWLSPIFPSPNDDNGYDISDYQGILSEFGTMADFDTLLSEAHHRGIRILLDLVINHTSDEHAWFAESRSSRHNPKRDWYIWRDGKDGGPPNNWQSIFNESAWTYDSATDQYFLHLFSARQPDLNWENPEMRQALYAMVRWWLDKGVDGFRIDAITHIKKEAGFPDMPNPDGLKTVPSLPGHLNRPGIQDYIRELCDEAFAGYDIMTVGEANGVDLNDAPNWVAADQHKFNMLFQFEQLKLWGSDNQLNLNLPQLKKTLNRWQQGLDGRGWNALFVENHDLPRIVSSWGDTERYWRESATAIATMYFLMQGTPFIYQGQELGMVNYPFSRLEEFDDVAVHNLARQRYDEGWHHDDILNTLRDSARDNSRTPMQWDDAPHAGFTRGEPWLPAHPNHPDVNVKHQTDDPASVLNFYKALIRLRRDHSTLIYGRFDLLLEEHPQVFAYQRTHGAQRYLVMCNMSDQPASIRELSDRTSAGDCLLSNINNAQDPTLLQPFEARVIQVG